jgi:serine/threonine protein kinase
MPVADENLIMEAVQMLGCLDKGAIGAVGGQKAVRLVELDGQSLVLKVISVDFASEETLKRAEREVKLLTELACLNVVKVASPLIELGSPVHGAAWLEEYLDGNDLTASLGAQWSWSDARDMATQISKGVAAGHEKGVIHRDLSANNIRKLSDGTYKVLDFGFAKHTLQSGITVAGQPGTYRFLSPEHLNSYSGGPMPASDVFQIGILLYYALAGALPFPFDGNDADYFRRLQGSDYIRLQTVRADLSPQVIALVERMLHPQPARRFLNGKRLAEALEAIA